MKYCPLCGKEYPEGDLCPEDQGVLIEIKSSTDPLIGQLLKDTYRIEEQIGAGGMGTVYRAVQMPLGRNVAIKCLLPTLLSTPSMVQRFFQEAKLLSQLSHPNVVGIIDFGNTETGLIYMVMELLDGATLNDTVPTGKGLPLPRALSLMRQACSGVGAAHRCSLVHRDLKPDNIFVARSAGGEEIVKVLDFGIARVMESEQQTRLTQTGLVMGTPGFIAPEQIEATGEADSRADIYALGAILYFMLTGIRPYHGATPQSIFVQQLQDAPRVDLEPLSALPQAARVVLKAMHRDPAERFGTAEEIVAALSSVVDPTAATQHAGRPAVGLSPDAVTPATGSMLGTGPGTGRGSVLDSGELAPTIELGTDEAKAPPKRAWAALIAAFLIFGILAGVAIWWTTRDATGGDRQEAASEVRGVTADSIRIGMSGPFSGASRELGRGMQLGIETCFLDVNEQGGIHGRTLELIALDDGYEPSRTVANMAELLFEREVFAILGNVGTPTAEVALPLALEQKVPFFGAFTGADLLRRDPPDPYVFNYRASYSEETAAIVEYFLDVAGLEPSEIGVFAQQDSFGDTGYRGVVSTLEQRGYRDEVPRFGYRRNTVAIEEAAQALLTQQPQVRALVLVATYRAASRLIRRVEDAGRELTYASLSFVGSRAFADELSEMGPQYAEGVIVSQVVPHFDSRETGVQRYRELLAQHFPAEQPGFVSLEGYLAARILVEALTRGGEQPTGDGLITAAEAISNLDLGIGPRISFTPERHQATQRVWGT
ncbi:MAG: ABC transporter substrate-binding protein, partial [Acidobacteriota bacterium]